MRDFRKASYAAYSCLCVFLSLKKNSQELYSLCPAPELVLGEYAHGHTPLALASENRDWVCVYVPAGGVIRLDLPAGEFAAQWYDPRTGEISDAIQSQGLDSENGNMVFQSLGGESVPGKSFDWVWIGSKK